MKTNVYLVQARQFPREGGADFVETHTVIAGSVENARSDVTAKVRRQGGLIHSVQDVMLFGEVEVPRPWWATPDRWTPAEAPEAVPERILFVKIERPYGGETINKVYIGRANVGDTVVVHPSTQFPATVRLAEVTGVVPLAVTGDGPTRRILGVLVRQ